MAITAEALNNTVDAGIAAMAAGNFTSALTKFTAAKAILSVLPDGKQGSSEVRWDRHAIDGLIDQVRQLKAASPTTGGIRRSNIVYGRANDCD